MNKQLIKNSINNKFKAFSNCLKNYSEVNFELKQKIENGINALQSISEKLDNYQPGVKLDLSGEKNTIAIADNAVKLLESEDSPIPQQSRIEPTLTDDTALTPNQHIDLINNGNIGISDNNYKTEYGYGKVLSDNYNRPEPVQITNKDWIEEEGINNNIDINKDNAELAFFSYVDDFCQTHLGFDLSGKGTSKTFSSIFNNDYTIELQDIIDIVNFSTIKANFDINNKNFSNATNRDINYFNSLKSNFEYYLSDVINFSQKELPFFRANQNFSLLSKIDTKDTKKTAIAGGALGALTGGALAAIKKNKSYDEYANNERASGRIPMSRAKWVLLSDEVLTAGATGAVAGGAGGAMYSKHKQKQGDDYVIDINALTDNNTKNGGRSNNGPKASLKSLARQVNSNNIGAASPNKQNKNNSLPTGMTVQSKKALDMLKKTENLLNTGQTTFDSPVINPFTGQTYTDAKALEKDLQYGFKSQIKKNTFFLDDPLLKGTKLQNKFLTGKMTSKDYEDIYNTKVVGDNIYKSNKLADLINALNNRNNIASKQMVGNKNKQTWIPEITSKQIKSAINTSDPRVKPYLDQILKANEAIEMIRKNNGVNGLTDRNNLKVGNRTINVINGNQQENISMVNNKKRNQLYKDSEGTINRAKDVIAENLQKIIDTYGGVDSASRFFSDNYNRENFFIEVFYDNYQRSIK